MPARAERSAAAPWRSRAFGLELEGSFPAPGLPPLPPDRVTSLRGAARPAPAAPLTRLELVEPRTIDQAWPDSGARRLLAEDLGQGLERTIDHHPEIGYRLFARGFGLALVSPDGRLVRCAPPDLAPWRWQRFLVGRVLPWAAILSGLEAFHAGAVAVGGKAIALVGPSGAGKTSLVARLVLAGAGFLTDDVLALDRASDGALRAHPGASVVGLRAAELEQLSAAERERLGTLLGNDDKAYLSLARSHEAVPLGAVYFLTTGERAGGSIEPLPAPDPRILMASTFVLTLATPDRLQNLLDVCAEIASSVPAHRVRVEPGTDARALAARLDAHARALLS